ncbi:hypothetical protein XENTR_v10018149 [Xenopus tropicalis]|nr:hypothetical protein XENTR_v10018149 [Xenopus tropicalis]
MALHMMCLTFPMFQPHHGHYQEISPVIEAEIIYQDCTVNPENDCFFFSYGNTPRFFLLAIVL